MKVICKKDETNRVIGFHVFGEHAAEITQGIAVAMKYVTTIIKLFNSWFSF